MTYSCDVQPRTLPIIPGRCLIINQGTDDIILGNDARVLKAYGAHIPPNQSLSYDLSEQRWIASATGAQQYDILPGAEGLVPNAQDIAAEILASALATNIALAIAGSTLASTIAVQVLTTGVRQIDVPVNIASGAAVAVGVTGLNLGFFDTTAYQSIEFAVRYDAVAAFPAAGDWMRYQFLWYDDTATNLLWVDTFEHISTSEPSGNFAGKFTFCNAPVKGARLQIVSAIGSAASTVTYNLWGTNRAVPRFTLRQDFAAFGSTDNILAAGQSIPGAGPGTTATVFIPIFTGSALIRFAAVGTAAQTVRVQLFMGSPGQAFWDDTYTIGPALPASQEIKFVTVMPRRGFRMVVTNNGAGAANGVRYTFVSQEP